MAHMKITVDDAVIMDGDIGEWSFNPPELLTDQLKAGAQPKPWMRAVMLTIADAAMRSQSMDITVRTNPKGWAFEVTEPA